jgi:galactokinase
VTELAEALDRNDSRAIGSIMAASFAGARDLFEISIPAMQAMMDAMSAAPGIVGCRQAGAGFGGCMVAMVEEEAVDEFCFETAAAYRTVAGLKPEIYPIRTTPGAGVLEFG